MQFMHVSTQLARNPVSLGPSRNLSRPCLNEIKVGIDGPIGSCMGCKGNWYMAVSMNWGSFFWACFLFGVHRRAPEFWKLLSRNSKLGT